MSSQEADTVQMVRKRLESEAKEIQDKIGGGRGDSAVVTQQVVVPSEVGKRSEEVYFITVHDVRYNEDESFSSTKREKREFSLRRRVELFHIVSESVSSYIMNIPRVASK
jgi:hypothetical protein